jgi:predicted transcriptional regulator
MNIDELCSRTVVVALPGTSVQEGARMLREHHVGALVVIDSRDSSCPVGIVTDRDMVVEVLAMGVDPAKFTVADLMTGNIVTVSSTEGVIETIKRMQQEGVRRVLVPLLAEALTGLANTISGGQGRERQHRN